MSWNVNRLDEDMIKRQRTIAAVVVNGEINTALCTKARQSTNPLYKKATGSDSNNYSKITGGDIVYTESCNNGISMNTYSQNVSRANNKMKGVSVLNGQGKDSNEAFIQKIQILGVAEMSNVDNSSQLYTILRGGIVQVTNNSNVTINPGDWIQAYAPTPEEARGGGKGKLSDRNGEITLWYKPYEPTEHALKSKQIYECLKESHGKKDADLDQYALCCKKFKQSSIDKALVIIRSFYDEIKKETIDPNRDVAMEKIAKLLDDDKDKRIEKSLFAPYSGPTLPNNNDLKTRQLTCVDTFLTSASLLQNTTTNRVIGKALTGAAPKKDFILHIGRYGL